MAVFTRENKVSSKLVYEGQICSLRVDQAQKGDHIVTREVIEHNGGVVIACQPDSNSIILVKQYRYSINRELLELPAGRLEKGEIPLDAAKRELREETGYSASNWQDLSKMFTAPGFCDELLHLYSANNVSLGEKAPDHDEETEVIVLSVKEAWQKVLQGEICDAKTIAGLALLLN
jgi:ADP-ribose pyrophosphatase